MNRIASARLPSALLAIAALALSAPLHAANGISVLHSFNYADGQYPEGRLVQGPDGAFYGTIFEQIGHIPKHFRNIIDVCGRKRHHSE